MLVGQALERFEVLGSRLAAAEALIELGHLAVAEGGADRLAEGLACFEKAEMHLRAFGISLFQARVGLEQAEVLVRLDRAAEAARRAETAGALFAERNLACSADPPINNCSTLGWSSSHAIAVYLDGEGVPGTDTRSVCPPVTHTYQWRFVTREGDKSCEAVVPVVAPIPPTPVQLEPSDGARFGNPATVRVRWLKPVLDDSAIKWYVVEAQWRVGYHPWQDLTVLRVPGSEAWADIPIVPGYGSYAVRWRVGAVNNQDQAGSPTDWWYYSFAFTPPIG